MLRFKLNSVQTEVECKGRQALWNYLVIRTFNRGDYELIG